MPISRKNKAMTMHSIKNHLSSYSIFQKRSTTISHAFASALAPVDVFNERELIAALKNLGQKDLENLTCVYCNNHASTWDHLVCLVKDGELNGFGHQIGNLVPCCKACNSEKGRKNYKQFVETLYLSNEEKLALINRLQNHLSLAKEFRTENLSDLQQKKYLELKEVKKEIFELMRKADEIVQAIRKGSVS
jgi:hypothetical protein